MKIFLLFSASMIFILAVKPASGGFIGGWLTRIRDHFFPKSPGSTPIKEYFEVVRPLSPQVRPYLEAQGYSDYLFSNNDGLHQLKNNYQLSRDTNWGKPKIVLCDEKGNPLTPNVFVKNKDSASHTKTENSVDASGEYSYPIDKVPESDYAIPFLVTFGKLKIDSNAGDLKKKISRDHVVPDVDNSDYAIPFKITPNRKRVMTPEPMIPVKDIGNHLNNAGKNGDYGLAPFIYKKTKAAL